MIALLLMSIFAPAHAAIVQSATIEAVSDGRVVQLPLLRNEVSVDISGDLASVEIIQTFANPQDLALDARYLFPLPEDAAVHAMRLVAGDVVIEAEIKRVEEAQQVFNEAKASGKQAALLTQHRPNVFTQDIANLPPGHEVRVEIEYAHAIPKQDGAYNFHFPMTVGPRYVPADREHSGDPEPLAMGEWNVKSQENPQFIAPARMSLDLHLNGGAAIHSVRSPSHQIAVTGESSTRDIRLDGPIRNDDFVLRYTLADDELAASLTAYADQGRGVMSLLIDPPSDVLDSRLTPREMVFVLDTSGSMRGAPMQSSKAFMRKVLETLRPTDSFRIVRFSRNASQLSSTPLPATAANLEKGFAYVDHLAASGGTEMRSGVEAAFGPKPIPGTVRNVVFLTDGYIGNDVDVIRLVEANRGEARLFSLGIGTSVNRYLLEEMARAGKGTARVVLNMNEAETSALELAERLASPYLTDIRIDWGKAPIRDATPRILPDLYLGEPLRILAKFDKPGSWDILVHGKIAGADATLPLHLELPEDDTRPDALPITWASSQVSDLMVDYLNPRIDTPARNELREKVTVLGLEYKLATQWTAFVAVAPELAPQVAKAPTYTGSSGVSWGGNAAPEPGGWAALILMALAGFGLKRGGPRGNPGRRRFRTR